MDKTEWGIANEANREGNSFAHTMYPPRFIIRQISMQLSPMNQPKLSPCYSKENS